jgi:hypothetical protein
MESEIKFPKGSLGEYIHNEFWSRWGLRGWHGAAMMLAKAEIGMEALNMPYDSLSHTAKESVTAFTGTVYLDIISPLPDLGKKNKKKLPKSKK